MFRPYDQRASPSHYAWLVVIACVACLAVAPYSTVSVDVFWHIAIGREWWESGLSPWVDHYSYTFAGETLSSVPYMFDITMAALDHRLGPAAAAISFKVAFACITLVVIGVWLRTVGAPIALSAALLAIVVATIQLRLMARPELVSNALIPLLFLLAYRAGPELRLRPMVAVVALILFWSNYHTPIFGYVILLGFFVDAALEYWRNRHAEDVKCNFWVCWFGWGVAVVLVGFATPNSGHPLFALLTFSPEWKDVIYEYERSALYASLPIAYLLLGISLLALYLIVRSQQYGALVVWTVCMYNALLTARLVVPVGIILVCVIAQYWPRPKVGRSKSASSLRLVAFSSVVLVVTLWSGIKASLKWPSYDSQIYKFQPTAVVEHMKAHDIYGKMFNVYEAGAYLVYALGTKANVYIDGRTDILYPFEHFDRYKKASINAATLGYIIKSDDVQLAILRNQDSNHHLASRTGMLELEFVGTGFALFKRRGQNARLATLGQWFAEPACIVADESSNIAAEMKLVRESSPEDSSLRHFAGAAAQYLRDPEAFLNHEHDYPSLVDSTLRLIAHAARDKQEWDKVIRALRHIDKARLNDMLMLSSARLSVGKVAEAEDTILGATRVPWADVTIAEIQITMGLIDSLKARGAGMRLKKEFVNELDAVLSQKGLPRAAPEQLVRAHFCSAKLPSAS